MNYVSVLDKNTNRHLVQELAQNDNQGNISCECEYKCITSIFMFYVVNIPDISSELMSLHNVTTYVLKEG